MEMTTQSLFHDTSSLFVKHSLWHFITVCTFLSSKLKLMLPDLSEPGGGSATAHHSLTIWAVAECPPQMQPVWNVFADVFSASMRTVGPAAHWDRGSIKSGDLDEVSEHSSTRVLTPAGWLLFCLSPESTAGRPGPSPCGQPQLQNPLMSTIWTSHPEHMLVNGQPLGFYCSTTPADAAASGL